MNQDWDVEPEGEIEVVRKDYLSSWSDTTPQAITIDLDSYNYTYSPSSSSFNNCDLNAPSAWEILIWGYDQTTNAYTGPTT